jgi:hypothetical protein
MCALRRALAAVVLLTLLLLPTGVDAAHDRTCHPNGADMPIESISFNFEPVKDNPGRHVRSLGRGSLLVQWGEALTEDLVALDTHGALHIHDGTSNTVLIAESTGASASCAADRGGELESLNLLFRNARSGERASIRIVFADGSVPGPDDWTGVMTVRSPGIGTITHDIVLRFATDGRQ